MIQLINQSMDCPRCNGVSRLICLQLCDEDDFYSSILHPESLFTTRPIPERDRGIPRKLWPHTAKQRRRTCRQRLQSEFHSISTRCRRGLSTEHRRQRCSQLGGADSAAQTLDPAAGLCLRGNVRPLRRPFELLAIFRLRFRTASRPGMFKGTLLQSATGPV